MTVATGTAKAPNPMGLAWDPESLPPFPAVALKALKLMSGTDTSLIELCNLIRPDPAFSAAVLRMANSPLVAFSKDISSVLQASMLLGFRRLRSLVMTLGLKAYLHNPYSPLMQLCWRHSVACAIVAERSASWTGLDKDFAYTAGILHDIGRVAMATIMPESYTRVLERGADGPQDVIQAEREFCGIDHCEAGHSLVVAWELPEAFIEITARHHDPTARPVGAASLIAPSCRLADALGFAVIRCRIPLTYAEAVASFPDRARKRFPAEEAELAAEIANQINVIELV
ncbi:MAG: HDOD domain-containing protein [Terriglobales bacterium]